MANQVNGVPRKPRILLAASGSVAAIKFANLCHCFSEWAEVKAVATKASLHFIDRASPPKDVTLYTDDGLGGDLRVYLEGVLASENVQKYVE